VSALLIIDKPKKSWLSHGAVKPGINIIDNLADDKYTTRHDKIPSPYNAAVSI
jgi:hypothetical protein